MRDPTAGFTDMQWYMYRQRNVAFFAAFTSRVFSADDLLAAARGLIALAPQLSAGFGDLSDDLLRRLIYRESVADLDGLPDRWIDRGEAVFADPALPLFRIRYAAAETPTDGRGGFLLVQVSHALVEGADSALLARSQSAVHPVASSTKRVRHVPDAARTMKPSCSRTRASTRASSNGTPTWETCWRKRRNSSAPAMPSGNPGRLCEHGMRSSRLFPASSTRVRRL